jgi:hypothetical protein
MTLQLDPPRTCGRFRLAALCERRRTAQAWPGGVAGQCNKTPAAVLIAEGDRLRAVDLAGRPLDIATLEAACPGLVAAMTDPEAA